MACCYANVRARDRTDRSERVIVNGGQRCCADLINLVSSFIPRAFATTPLNSVGLVMITSASSVSCGMIYLV